MLGKQSINELCLLSSDPLHKSFLSPESFFLSRDSSNDLVGHTEDLLIILKAMGMSRQMDILDRTITW